MPVNGSKLIKFAKTLVHELLHLKFCLLSESGNELQDRYVHQLIEELSKAFVFSRSVEPKTRNDELLIPVDSKKLKDSLLKEICKSICPAAERFYTENARSLKKCSTCIYRHQNSGDEMEICENCDNFERYKEDTK